MSGCETSSKNNWELVWSDEFDYVGLPDVARWNYDTVGNSYGWGNNELEYYTVAKEANAHVDGEFLHIVAQKEQLEGFNYTSARLTTKGKGDWLYGKVEVRAKLAGGRGLWPAIWMLPTDWAYGDWPASGEIDVMEHVGYEPDSVYTTIHTEAFNHSIGTQVGGHFFYPTSESAFHVYAIEWYPNKIDFFIDNEKVFTFNNSGKGTKEWPFNQPFHLIMNVAVGGNWGGLRGVDDAVFPASMLIDYVRVYQKE